MPMRLYPTAGWSVVDILIDTTGTGQNRLEDWLQSIALLQQATQNGREGLRGGENSVMEQDKGPRLYLACCRGISF